MSQLSTAIHAFTQGLPVVIMDDTDRENEGDLCYPAFAVTEANVLFSLKASTGILCVACSPQRIDELGLPPMVQSEKSTDPNKTPFTVTVDLLPEFGVTTGVSVADKCKTIRALADPQRKGSDFSRPGHIFPLRASPKGLFGRQGHTEASVELCKLAQVYPACLIAELMNADGTMSRILECREFCDTHHIPFVSVKDILEGLQLREARLPIAISNSTVDWKISYYQPEAGISCVLLSRGELRGKKNVPLRIHSECLTGDVFASARCDCGSQLQRALAMLSNQEHGLLIYVRGHEGRGIGLGNKILAYTLQDAGEHDTCTANLALGLPLDCRRYEFVPDILARLGILSVDLLSDNLEKEKALGAYLDKMVPFEGAKTLHNANYIAIKKTLHGERSPPVPSSLSQPKRLPKVGLAYTTAWHAESVGHMVNQCRNYLAPVGGLRRADIVERTVSGSFELVMGANHLFEAGCDSVIVIGILQKGETYHFEAIVSSVSVGVMNLQLDRKKPLIYGVLTCYTDDQIKERVYGSKNAVLAWCQAALDMI